MKEAEQHDALFLSMDDYTYASLCLWAFRIKLPSSNTQQGGTPRTVHPNVREASRLQTFQLFQNINSFKLFAPVPVGAVMSRAAVWELKGSHCYSAPAATVRMELSWARTLFLQQILQEMFCCTRDMRHRDSRILRVLDWNSSRTRAVQYISDQIQTSRYHCCL